MLACDQTCTLYHKSCDPDTRLDAWTATVLTGVSWYAKQGVTAGKDGLNSADTLTVRIPVEAAPDELSASPGDLIVKGESGPIASPRELAGKERYTVTVFRDNRRGPEILHHFKIEGEA